MCKNPARKGPFSEQDEKFCKILARYLQDYCTRFVQETCTAFLAGIRVIGRQMYIHELSTSFFENTEARGVCENKN